LRFTIDRSCSCPYSPFFRSVIPAGAAAFLGALVAGLLASIVKRKIQYPQNSITAPAIVIMVPGLYMYRAMYNIGLTSISVGTLCMTKAHMIVVFLPIGMIAERIRTDSKWRPNVWEITNMI